MLTPANVPAAGTATIEITGRRTSTPRALYPSDSVTLTGPTVQTLRFAPGAYDTVATTTSHSDTANGYLQGRALIHGHPVAASSTNIQESVDFASDFLAVPSNLDVDCTDPARPVTTLGAPAPTFDATLVYLRGLRGTDPVSQYLILFIAPPGKTSLKVPELPASLSAVTPEAADTLSVFIAAFVDIDVVNGYRPFLAIPNFIGFIAGQPPGVAGEYLDALLVGQPVAAIASPATNTVSTWLAP